MGALQLAIITVETVGKILICCLVGLCVSHYFASPAKSVRGIGAVLLRVFIPCLLFSNLVLRLTWSSLGNYYWAPLLACIATSLGALGSYLFRPLLNRKWHPVLTLGCTFQNGLTFSLSIVLTLRGVAWLTPEAVERATSYIFLYNSVCSIGLWAIGEPMIRLYKEQAVRERLERRRLRQQLEQGQYHVERSEAFDAIERIVYPYELNHSLDKCDKTAKANGMDHNMMESTSNHEQLIIERAATPNEQFAWYLPSDNATHFSLLDITENDNKNSSIISTLLEMAGRIPSILMSPPVCSTLSAIVISLVPPLRWLAESPPGGVIIGGMKIIGAATIPFQLLLLGCNVANSRPTPLGRKNSSASGGGPGNSNKDGDDDDDEGEEGEAEEYVNNSNTAGTTDGRRKFIQTLHISEAVIFTVVTSSLRLFFIPLVCFVVIHLLLVGGIIPAEREFLLTVLLGTCAPSAINSHLICIMHSYKTRSYAQMIFVMYVSAIVTTAFWLAFYIWYLVTVGKVILVAVMGIWASRYLVHKSKSLTALSYMAVKIFLPCLLLSQIAKDISWEMIRTYYWACILPFIPMAIGLGSAFAFRSFIPSELFGLLQLACTFQNVISYGLGIALNLDISWYDKAAAIESQSYVFLYNIVHSLFLWSVGSMIIEKCTLALAEEGTIQELSVITMTEADQTSHTPTPTSTTGTKSLTAVEKDAAKHRAISSTQNVIDGGSCLNYDPVTRLEDYRPTPVSTATVGKRKVRPSQELTWSEYILLQLSYLMTEQLIASFIGLLIALVPPFGALVDNKLGEIILGGISLLAPCTVPLQLLVLGVNITADADGSAELPLRFLLAVITLRLFFIPLICFGIVHLLVVNALMPYNKPFILIMLVLTCAPTAINTSIICSLYSYKVKEYTKLLLYMYVTCMFTTTAWLTLYVWYLES